MKQKLFTAFRAQRLAAALLAGAALLPALFASGSALAQDYPTRPVLFIFPFAAGGGGDAGARVIAQEMTKATGQNFVVEDRPGGSGMLGYNAIRTAKPDGYTLSLLHNGLTVIRRVADPRFGADISKDYDPVVEVWENYTQIAANPNAPFKDMAGFIAYAKANPGKINVSMGGLGSTDEIAADLVQQQAGIKFAVVPYNGNARAVQAVLSGEVDMIFGSSPLQQYVDGGKMVPLALISTRRSPGFASWIPITEVGLPDYQGINNWVGLFTTAGTPKDVVAKLNRTLNTIFQNPDVRKRAQVAGDLVGGTPEHEAERIRNEIRIGTDIIRKMNLKFD